MLLRRGFFSLATSLFVITSLYSQTADTQSPNNPTFQSNVKVVLVDVSVRGRKDEPIAGLKKEDFQIFEEGKSQTIASFEEHKGIPQNQAVIPPPLPPHFYTNYPLIKPADSVNVLMLDALNTPLADQASVRVQMVKYLKQIQPGPRLAILTLTSRVRMVEGFTTDPEALLAALNHKNWGGGLESSPMLRTEVDDNVDQQVMDDLAIAGGNSRSAAAQRSFEVMQEFLTEQTNYENRQRVEMTLDALQQVARYLGGFPGRKNVIWFSGSFPFSLLPSPGRGYDQSFPEGFTENIRRTTNMLAAAQVAIYPIAAAGLTGDSSGKASVAQMTTNPSGMSGISDGGAQIQELERQRNSLYSSQAAMEDIAKDTGGEAFYNTNGLKQAMATALHNGERYYTISYYPTDKKMDGSYRPIEVKVRSSHYKLSYRRGYFAENAKKRVVEQAQSDDPLRPLMVRGLPSSTEIIYKIRAQAADPQPAPNAPTVGDNREMKAPLIRYAVDFAVSTNDLDLKLAPDGTRHGNLEVTLVAYDHDGKTLNWLVRSMNMSLKPDLYAAFERGGVQLHEEIDVPKATFSCAQGSMIERLARPER